MSDQRDSRSGPDASTRMGSRGASSAEESDASTAESEEESIPEGFEYLEGSDDERYPRPGSRDPPRPRETDFDDEDADDESSEHENANRENPTNERPFQARYASPERDMRGAPISSRSPTMASESGSESPPTHRRRAMSRSSGEGSSRDSSPSPLRDRGTCRFYERQRRSPVDSDATGSPSQWVMSRDPSSSDSSSPGGGSP